MVPDSSIWDVLRPVDSLVEMTAFVQDDFAASDEYAHVRHIANSLLGELNSPESLALRAVAHTPGQPSDVMHEMLGEFVTVLDLFDEPARSPEDDSTEYDHPDYVRRLGDTGILLEIEHGEPTATNVDLVAFLKCHLHPATDYLFLMVPQAWRQTGFTPPVPVYEQAISRLAPFFVSGSGTNVRGLHIFGY